MNRLQRTTYLMATAAAFTGLVAIAPAGASTPDNRSANPTNVAVFGDVPYGSDQEASWGALIAAVNADPKVRLAVHVGDIKSGSTTCTDERFAAVRAAFDALKDPVVYTPGDNEWTDCHRLNNGSYNPLERLGAIRSIFFDDPGSTLGRRPMSVDFQPQLIENVRWVQSRVAFATLHVVGSNNGLSPWIGLGNTTPTAEQSAEVDARVAATLAWIDETFIAAEASSLQGVVLAMQADTWAPVPDSAQQAIVDRIAGRTAAFGGEVLLLQGDSHTFIADNPLGLDNFTRVVVHGETLPFEYLRLSIDPGRSDIFSWERVPVSAP